MPEILTAQERSAILEDDAHLQASLWKTWKRQLDIGEKVIAHVAIVVRNIDKLQEREARLRESVEAWTAKETQAQQQHDAATRARQQEADARKARLMAEADRVVRELETEAAARKEQLAELDRKIAAKTTVLGHLEKAEAANTAAEAVR
jgi:hypothetical protein